VGWYTPTSGIWQTVWLESRPKSHLGQFAITTAVDPAAVTFSLIDPDLSAAGEYTLTIRSADPALDSRRMTIRSDGKPGDAAGRTYRLTVKVPEPKLWTPATPHLYDVTLELKGADGRVDQVKTYFGLRTIARGRYGDEP